MTSFTCNFPRQTFFQSGVSAPPTQPLTGGHRDPETAALVRTLQATWAKGLSPDPWLPFPQRHGNLGYGAGVAPLPIGAPRLLWAGGAPGTQPCPACRNQACVVSAGGHPSVGGIDLVCPVCEARWHQSIGGLRRVAAILTAAGLAGTVFEARGPQARSDDGSALRNALINWGFTA